MARITQTADRVYRNAKVYSIALDGTETHAQAIAIKDGKFVYVGDEDGVRAWTGDTTEVIDCNTKALWKTLLKLSEKIVKDRRREDCKHEGGVYRGRR